MAKPAPRPKRSPSSGQPAPESSDWFAPIRAGDRRALAELFHAHYEGLCRFLTSYVGSFAVAEELVQDTFLTLWEKRRTLNPDGSAKAYLYGAARNRALNQRRRRKRELKRARKSARLEPRQLRTQDEDLRDREVSEAVRTAIDDLPERCRECFKLSRFGGLTYSEIAKVMEISPKTVEVHIGRALKQLRKQLAPIAPDQ